MIPPKDSTPWVLHCALCLHTPPGDKDIAQAARAVTVMEGIAVCEEHIDWFSLPDSVETWLVADREERVAGEHSSLP